MDNDEIIRKQRLESNEDLELIGQKVSEMFTEREVKVMLDEARADSLLNSHYCQKCKILFADLEDNEHWNHPIGFPDEQKIRADERKEISKRLDNLTIESYIEREIRQQTAKQIWADVWLAINSTSEDDAESRMGEVINMLTEAEKKYLEGK